VTFAGAAGLERTAIQISPDSPLQTSSPAECQETTAQHQRAGRTAQFFAAVGFWDISRSSTAGVDGPAPQASASSKSAVFKRVEISRPKDTSL